MSPIPPLRKTSILGKIPTPPQFNQLSQSSIFLALFQSFQKFAINFRSKGLFQTIFGYSWFILALIHFPNQLNIQAIRLKRDIVVKRELLWLTPNSTEFTFCFSKNCNTLHSLLFLIDKARPINPCNVIVPNFSSRTQKQKSFPEPF